MHAFPRAQPATTSGRLGTLLRFGRRPSSVKAIEPAPRQEPVNFGRNGFAPTPVVLHLNGVPVPQEITLTALRTVPQLQAKPAQSSAPSLAEVRRRVNTMFENLEPMSELPIF